MKLVTPRAEETMMARRSPMGAGDEEQATTSKNKQWQARREEISSLNFEWPRSRGGRRKKDITRAPLVPGWK